MPWNGTTHRAGPTVVWPGLAGERIVTFVRPGKPRRECLPTRCHYRAFADFLPKSVRLKSCEIATVSKAPSDRKPGYPLPSWKLKVAATKKRDVRRSVQQKGWITLDGGFAARQCLVHDMSSTGAKITVADSSVLSGRLRLAFSRDANTGRQCNVVWRRGRSFGVKFVR
jgi:hypothetical protein